MPGPRRAVTPEDIYRLRSVADPQISPDGKWVACVISQANRQKDRWLSDIWLVSTDGRRRMQLTNRHHRDQSPRWSPDGKRVAFVSPEKDDDKAKSQIWVIPISGGEAKRITQLKQGASSPVWSPDGKRIAFLARDPKREDDQQDEKQPKLEIKQGRIYATDVKEITELRYRSTDFLPKEDRRHVYLVPASGGKPRKLTDGNCDDSHPVWSPDGKQIAFVSNRGRKPDWDLVGDIWLMSAAGGKPHRFTTLVGGAGDFTWSPDGKWIAFVGSRQERIPWLHLELLAQPARGGEAIPLTSSLDRLPSSPRWTPDGSAICFQCHDEGFLSLWRTDLRGRVERLLPKQRFVASYTISKATGEIAFTHLPPDHPAELYCSDPTGKRERRLTNENDAFVRSRSMSVPECLWCRSFDGTRVQAWVIKPPTFRRGRKYPAVVMTHGGPYGAFFETWRLDVQTLAAQGFVVIYANCRGSSGYGEKFQTTVVGKWGPEDSRDYLAALDHVIRQGYVDRKRVGVTGGSYGGFMTVWLLGTTDRFAAGVAECAATDEPMFYYSADMQQWSEQELGGPPWERLEDYRRVSASTHAHRIKAPLLLLHAEDDSRVPISHSEIVYTTIKRLGVESTFVRYPSGGHGFGWSAPRYVCDYQNRAMDWFGKHLR